MYRQRLAARLAWWLGMLLALPGVLLGDATLVSLGSIFLPLGFLLDDLSRAARGGITAMSAYSASAAITSFANTVALSAAATPDRWKYYLYVSEQHVTLAMCLWLAAVIIPPLVFRIMQANRTAQLFHSLLPRVHGDVSDRQLVRGGILLGIALVVYHWRVPSGSLGTLSAVIFLAPLFITFSLARAGAERQVRGALGGALFVASAEAARALLFGYLRINVLAPFVAFVAGMLAGSRSFKPLASKIFLPVYGVLALFVIYFGAFGAMRASSGSGLERLQAVQEYYNQPDAEVDTRNQSVLSRLTTINQLSQIGRIVQDEGFLNGQTMGYLAYAFMPRFLWPSKPTVAKGAWFALRIGLARILPDGRISNSINMTIPGELYLNYGWTGVMLGLAFLGAFVSMLWQTTGFWSSSRNVLGTAFGFYLAWPWIGFNLGADLQILVTLIATYLIFVAVGIILPSLPRGVRRVGGHPSPVPSA